ncbi:MAG: hypothetical protein MK077_01690 [Phycisphaerales bacterium]|nr:hypothetical protein [Phycisphaerales bacterium]
MPRLMLLIALSGLTGLAGCEDPSASEHRVALQTLTELQESLLEIQPGDAKASGALQTIAREAGRVRSDDKTLKSIASRVTAEAELGLATIQAQNALTDMMQASLLIGQIEALGTGLANLTALSTRLDDRQDIDLDTLASTRVELTNQMANLKQARAQYDADVSAMQHDVGKSLAAIQQQGQQAAQLRADADQMQGQAAMLARTQAANVDLQAAKVEAEMDRRKAVLELDAQPQLHTADINVKGMEDHITAVDTQAGSMESLASARNAQQKRIEQAKQEIDQTLSDDTQTLAALLTESLKKSTTQSRAHLAAAAKAASNAARSRRGKDGLADRLLELQAQVATAELTISEVSILHRCISTMAKAAASGSRTLSATWTETRTVLESQADMARTDGQKAIDASRQLADGLGAGQGDSIIVGLEALQASLSGDFSDIKTTSPPIAPSAAAASAPTTSTSIAGLEDVPAGLQQLVDQLAAAGAMPPDQMFPAIKSVTDCEAVGEDCQLLALMPQMANAINGFVDALTASPMGKDPMVGMMLGGLRDAMLEQIPFTVQSVRSTSSSQGDITIIDGSGKQTTLQAAESASGWKLTSLMSAGDAPDATIEQIQGMIAAMNTGAEELRSGKIQTPQQLQQLLSRLAPQ